VTAARFSMALDNGLTLPDEKQAGKFFCDLPLFSQQPIGVLTLAREHGAAWHHTMCVDAAFFGDFELLKWLRASGCQWNALSVALSAIRGKTGQYELILSWLLSVVKQWSQMDKNELLFDAGVEYDTAALELMLAQGAEWPSSFIGAQEVNGETVPACWHYNAVAWALNKGCRWGNWRCQDLAPDLYPTEDGYRADAINLFDWAHENDCPCTCEAAVADDAVV
jgi:hypothetical protein